MCERNRCRPQTGVQMATFSTLSVTIDRSGRRRRRLHCANAVRSLQNLLLPNYRTSYGRHPFVYPPSFLERPTQFSRETNQRMQTLIINNAAESTRSLQETGVKGHSHSGGGRAGKLEGIGMRHRKEGPSCTGSAWSQHPIFGRHVNRKIIFLNSQTKFLPRTFCYMVTNGVEVLPFLIILLTTILS